MSSNYSANANDNKSGWQYVTTRTQRKSKARKSRKYREPTYDAAPALNPIIAQIQEVAKTFGPQKKKEFNTKYKDIAYALVGKHPIADAYLVEAVETGYWTAVRKFLPDSF
jgi:hypothetical protein